MEIKTATPAELKARIAPYNPRRMSDAEREKLKRSIQKHGFVNPLVVNATTGTLLSGHQRLDAAEALDLEAVPYTEVELTPEKERLANIALNQIRGEFDAAKMDTLIGEIEADGIEPEDAGLDAEQISDIRAAVGGTETPEADIQQLRVKIPKAHAPAVKEALRAAKEAGPFTEYEEENQNSNGNALARIAETINADV